MDFHQIKSNMEKVIVGIMLDWIEKGMDENYNEIVDDLEKTVHGTIDLSIKNFTNNKK